jgi:hypothetical protein
MRKRHILEISPADATHKKTFEKPKNFFLTPAQDQSQCSPDKATPAAMADAAWHSVAACGGFSHY